MTRLTAAFERGKRRAIDAFGRNVAAWLLAFLLAVALAGSWNTGSDLRRLCELFSEHRLVGWNASWNETQIHKICGSHQPIEEDN